MTAAPKRRRWLQFSLKGMLVVMTLACVGLGWLAYERNEVRKREAAIEAIEQLGGTVEIHDTQPFRSTWLRPLLGNTSDGEVVRLFLNSTQVTDAGLVNLQSLTKLRRLYLDGTQVTDAGLVHLQGLKKLKTLSLMNTQVTDAGLVHLQGLKELEGLFLDGTQVTDAGLVHLQGLTKLKWLDFDGTQVTEQGVSDLKKALPNTRIGR